MQAMRPPSKSEATGYDVIVWVDEDGDIVARGFSRQGHSALRAFVNKYHAGDIVQIYCTPEAFMDELPTDLAVGVLNSRTEKVMPFNPAHLH